MRQHVVRLAPLALLGGCSLLYNPSNLPPSTDADIDAPPVDPTMLEIERVTPTVLAEGTGAASGRAGILVVHGKNMSPQNMLVTITAADGTKPEGLALELGRLDVSRDGDLLAVPIRQEVLPSLTTGTSVLLDVTVEQDSANGRITRTIKGALTLRGLDELIVDDTGADLQIAPGVKEYSVINVRARALVAPTTQYRAPLAEPVILRSMSSVSIAGEVRVSANGQRGGAGGGAGGDGGGGLLGGSNGGVGDGPHGGGPSSDAADFETGDPGLSTLNLPLRGSGGGGGAQGALGATGGAGGGGGGSVEITARDSLTVGTVNARGAAGLSAATIGGGGSGGVILLRAGSMLTAGNIDVSGGGAGDGGRARYDAGGVASVQPGDLGANHFRGPMFNDLPEITKSSKPELKITGKAFFKFAYFFTQGGATKGPFEVTLGDESAVVTPPEGLFRGVNQVCLIVDQNNTSSDTRNCIDLVFVP